MIEATGWRVVGSRGERTLRGGEAPLLARRSGNEKPGQAKVSRFLSAHDYHAHHNHECGLSPLITASV
jgi:hypothetical protein